jgi:hypothetical protein
MLELILVGVTCIASTCIGLYWGVLIGTNQISWLKTTRRK